MLLILTSDKDLTADFLIVELINRNLPYFRLNTEELAQAEFTFSLVDEVPERRVRIGPKSLDLNEVSCVWYRRAIYPSARPGLSKAERAFIAGELRHLAFGLVFNPAVRWVNRIDKVYVAEHKLYQLQIAQEIGFKVPRTLVSSSAAELREFSLSNGHGTICKPIFHGMFADQDASYSIYTRRVSADSFDPDTVANCPVFLQEEIPRSADVRATFIGDRCFVAEITGEPSLVDWRDPDLKVTHAVSHLTPETEGRCRTMLAKLGLLYGAFDFVKTPDGGFVFLEVNPTGEWAWLEERLEFPMRNAFIELFYGEGK